MWLCACVCFFVCVIVCACVCVRVCERDIVCVSVHMWVRDHWSRGKSTCMRDTDECVPSSAKSDSDVTKNGAKTLLFVFACEFVCVSA